MNHSIHKIIVSYKGRMSTIHYWADGHGRRVDGIVTSLPQLRVVLQKKYGARALDLYYVDGRRLKPITGDRHLTSALDKVRKGGSLIVQAYEHRDLDFSSIPAFNRLSRAQATR